MKTRRAAAFTLVEVLVALSLMAILTPLVVHSFNTCAGAASAAERGSTATRLAENKLSEMLLDNAWSSGTGRGDFGEDFPGYTWELQSADWATATGMTELTVLVTYRVQGFERVAQLSTLVSTTSTETGQ